jgi:hypothetical protein
MRDEIIAKLETLKDDFNKVKSRPFHHFYCPILFRDEEVELCQAHIINYKFPNSSRIWTVQRKDVDNFYGSNFEADFIAIQHLEERNLGKVLPDKKLSRLLNAQILLEDSPIDFFVAKGKIPGQFTPMEFDNGEEVTKFGLKIARKEILAAEGKTWNIAVNKDVRIHALVSLIKMAHLTLFHILGYEYALSAGGTFFGRNILGEFFLRYRDKQKPEVLDNALPYFREFEHMVRPLQFTPDILRGTVSDNRMFLCKTSNQRPWAFIVMVKISKSMHAVLVPIMEDVDTTVRFYDFLRSPQDKIEVALCEFKGDHWLVDKYSRELIWPKDGTLYPEA